jgi:phosphatidylglycerol:prolipoprotein diacylglycerol transferase
LFPYLDFGPFDLGPFRIYPFGAMVACALLTWLVLILRRAARAGLDPRLALRLFETILAAGFIGAVLFGLFLSGHFTYSSFGGAFGALLGAAIYLHRQKILGELRWRYLDLLAYAFPFGWSFLRLGCTLIHDHPGKLTSSWLGVHYPDGTRYDLGLLEMICSLAVACIFLVLGRGKHPPGYFIRWLIICGPIRILLDVVRENPPRYLGLTADQIGGIVLIAAGAGIWNRIAATCSGQ